MSITDPNPSTSASANTSDAPPKRVAVIGSGCSGLAAVWALQSTPHEVHLFEAADRLGGHTNTCSFRGADGSAVPVDTGFIVMNTATYPNFIRFLAAVGIEPAHTAMTFGVSRDGGAFEWAGTSLAAVFAQRRNLLSPRMWRMLFDVVRFNQFALDLLAKADESENDPVATASAAASSTSGPTATTPILPDDLKMSAGQESIGAYLDREGYSAAFRDDYLIPMTACVWSTTPDKCALDFPALTLVRFLWNHHLLSTVAARPAWMTIPGGSKRYVDAVVRDVPPGRIHLNSKVNALFTRADGRILVQLAGLRTEVFDHVILATHGDVAADIMAKTATPDEARVLACFETSKNRAVMHSDLSLMPKRPVAWSAWNYLTTSGAAAGQQVCLTYWMNLLQHIDQDRHGPVLVTLNPLKEPKPETVQGEYEYSHPLYNAAAIRGQKALPAIQNTRGISYAGAWTKYGFHEDGFSSGLEAAINHLGASVPFQFVDSTFSRGTKPVLNWQDHAVRIVIRFIQIAISIVNIQLMLLGIGRESVKRKLH